MGRKRKLERLGYQIYTFGAGHTMLHVSTISRVICSNKLCKLGFLLFVATATGGSGGSREAM